MLEWLSIPIDATRGHDLSSALAWHGRLMVLTWSVLFPLGILAARFFKRTKRQKWPETLDNKAWWIAHNALQYSGGVVLLVAAGFVVSGSPRSVHGVLGLSVIGMTLAQFLGGWLRGSKGGPTDRHKDGSLNGDHYDMTRRRRAFEYIHKSLGYVALTTAGCATLSGLWTVNAPRWMWGALCVWWLVLAAYSIILQRAGRAFDTYQAIWGAGHEHPGNRRRPIGWGVRRSTNNEQQ